MALFASLLETVSSDAGGIFRTKSASRLQTFCFTWSSFLAPVASVLRMLWDAEAPRNDDAAAGADIPFGFVQCANFVLGGSLWEVGGVCGFEADLSRLEGVFAGTLFAALWVLEFGCAGFDDFDIACDEWVECVDEWALDAALWSFRADLAMLVSLGVAITAEGTGCGAALGSSASSRLEYTRMFASPIWPCECLPSEVKWSKSRRESSALWGREHERQWKNVEDMR
jgi:hypothetical protein